MVQKRKNDKALKKHIETYPGAWGKAKLVVKNGKCAKTEIQAKGTMWARARKGARATRVRSLLQFQDNHPHTWIFLSIPALPMGSNHILQAFQQMNQM